MLSCPEAGCNRSFKRPEHLTRHRLNHQPRSIHQCQVCRKDFVRLDLLQRHMRRHARGMSYRNSGGYSTSGRPSSGSEPGSSPNPQSTSTLPQPRAPAAELYDAPSHRLGPGECPPGSTPVLTDDPTEIPSPTINIGLSEELAGILPARPGERTGPDHLTFFGASKDVTDLSEGLDWLFGVSPRDLSNDLDAFNIVTPNNNWTTWSPTSEVSHSSNISGPLPRVNGVLPRDKITASLINVPPDILSSSFFDPANLEWFMESYWSNYNPHFSLLHQPTFAVQDAPPLLLVALLTLGATLSPNPDHYRVAEILHGSLRWLIFTSPSFQAPAPLWVVQALLVVQSYEKMFSTRKLHEMSHIFHYSVITLMRRGSSYTQDQEEGNDTPSMRKGWYRWVERELSYRAAYFAFVMDAQHSSIFGHSAALSLTDIHLPLPCSDSLWNAPTAASWNQERAKAQPTPRFLPALRSLLSRRPIPHSYSTFAKFVLLHGLLCLTRHMITRDQTASLVGADQQLTDVDVSSSNTPEQDDWKERLDRAIDTWSLCLLSREPSLCLEAARPLQRIAHVSIHVSLVDFHVLAGAPNLATGNRIELNSPQFARAYRRVSDWARRRNVKRVLSHCLLLIQETMFTRNRYHACEDNLILRPWILYNTCLIVWAYGAISGAGRPRLSSSHGGEPEQWAAEEYLSYMLNELMGDGDPSLASGATHTAGLIQAVSTVLENSRWELLEEAKDTLNGLSLQTAVLAAFKASQQAEH